MLLTLAVGAGALNTGNNLLFLLLGMMLSAIIASGILSEAALRKLVLTRRSPARIFAKNPARGTFTLYNPRSYPSINIETSEQSAIQVEGPEKGLRAGEKDLPFYKFWQPDRFHDGAYVAIKRIPNVESKQELIIPTPYHFPSRGLYHSPGIRLATRFPFGIFHKIRDIDAPCDFLVFPQPTDASDWSADITANLGDISRNKAGHGEEYFGLRDWRDGEDRRNIHWKSSAKRNEFVVREFEEQEQRAIEILFMNTYSADSKIPQELAKKLFELHLQKLVGLLESLTQQHYAIALRTMNTATPMRQGHAHLEQMLTHLATISLEEATSAMLPASKVLTGPQQPRIARIAIGFEHTLQTLPEQTDLHLTIANPGAP